MTVNDVLKNNPNINILDNGFRILTIPYNNLIIYADGTVFLQLNVNTNYPTAIQVIENRLSKLPTNLPEFMRNGYDFSQELNANEVEQLNRFIDLAYNALD